MIEKQISSRSLCMSSKISREVTEIIIFKTFIVKVKVSLSRSIHSETINCLFYTLRIRMLNTHTKGMLETAPKRFSQTLKSSKLMC